MLQIHFPSQQAWAIVPRDARGRSHFVKLKLLARSLSSVGAPKMTVRRHVPWPLRAASFAALMVLGACAALWLWHTLVSDALFERQALQEKLALVEQRLGVESAERRRESAERQRLSALANAADSRLKMEQTAAERLAAQVRTLEVENAGLKADLAYLESLLPAGGSEGVIAVRRFEVQADAQPGRMRYRALLMQGGRSEGDFEGSVQLLVLLESEGRRTTVTVPDPADSDGRVKVSLRRHQRIEGSFEVPAGARVRSVQLRVMEGSAVRAQQTVVL